MPSTRPHRHAHAVPAAARPVGKGRLVLLAALVAVGPLTIDFYLPALPALADDLGATARSAQWTVTAALAGLAVGQLIVGPLSDAVGRRRPLLVGAAVHATASAVCAAAPTLPWLVAGRAVQGLAGAAIAVATMATVRDLASGPAGAVVLSRLMVVVVAAPVVAPAAGGALLTATTWRGLFAVLSAAVGVLAVVCALRLPETAPATDGAARQLVPGAARSYTRLLRDREFVAVVLAAGLVVSALFSYVAASPFVLQRGYGLSEQQYAALFAVNALALVAATSLNPTLLRRWPPRALVAGSAAAAAIAGTALLAAALSGAGGLAGIAVPLWFVVAACGLSFPNAPAAALERHGASAGAASAVLGSVQWGLASAGAASVAVLGPGSASVMAAVIVASASAAWAVLVAASARRRRAQPSRTDVPCGSRRD